MTMLTEVFPTLAARGDRPHDLIVVGDTGVDLLVAVDSLPRRDSKSIGRGLGIFAGGMGANFAASARRAAEELDIALHSRVGSDPFGRACILDLEDRRIDTSMVAVMPDQLTWWCAVAIDSDGEKALLGGRTPASLPDVSTLPAERVRSSRWLHILGDVPGSEEALRRARSGGAIASVDIEGSFVRTDFDRATELVLAADLAVLNAESLQALTGIESAEQALPELLRSQGRAFAVLLTLGISGSIFAWCDAAGEVHTVRHEAEPVAEVRDTTGAGDSFAGAFLGRALLGDDLTEALRIAAHSAAATISHYGARPGELPRWTTTNSKEHL